MNILTLLFGKSKQEEDREIIVRLMEEKHQLNRAIDAIKEREGYMFNVAMSMIGKRSPEDASLFYKKFNL